MKSRQLDVDLNEIVVFTRIVQLGSFTAASASLRVPKATISRRMAALEARVGARLLQRTTRKLAVTDVGQVYYEHCARIVAELEEAQGAVAELQSTPRGLLRVTVPLSFAMLGPIFSEYLKRYPDVTIDLVCTDRRVDLVEERFDLAIRAGEPQDSTLTSRRLGSVARVLVAAPGVARKIGRILTPGDLCQHATLAFAAEGDTWSLTAGAKPTKVKLRPRLVVNDFDMLLAMTESGCGVALLPENLCTEALAAGRLRRVLAGWTTPATPVFALYPSRRHLAPKVLALLELLGQRLDLAKARGS